MSGTTQVRPRSPSSARRGHACLAGLAIVQAAMGVAWLVERAQASAPGRFQATAATLVLILAIAQLLRVARAWRARTTFDPQRVLVQGGFWGLQLLGVVLALGVAFAFGPANDVAYLFAALVAIQYTFAAFWILVSPTAAVRLAPALATRRLRTSSAVVAAAVAGLLALECSLWVREQWMMRAIGSTNGVIATSTATESDFGPTARGLDTRPAALVAPPRRGLPIGNPHITLIDATDDSQTDTLLTLLEGQVPDAKLQVAPSGDGSAEQLAAACFDVAWRQPDLVLLFVTVDHRLTSRAAPAGWFDWRAWRVATMFVAGACDTPSQAQVRHDHDAETPEQQHERYLRESLRSFRLCRVESDDAANETWGELRSRLVGLNRRCAGRGVELALIVVPAEFQVRTELSNVLRRRGGFQPAEIDIELPQRRLAALAHEQGLPIIDLLPHLRAVRAPVFERHAQRLNEAGNRVAADTLARWLNVHYGETETPVAQAGGR
ncbi:MAG: hypothetical protein AB7U73_09145 [Pirellulales bacterium]